MGDDNTRAAWVCALWCGVAARLIRERVGRSPALTEVQVAVVRKLVRGSLPGHPYLEVPAAEALQALDSV